jgi:hypothetical protein
MKGRIKKLILMLIIIKTSNVKAQHNNKYVDHGRQYMDNTRRFNNISIFNSFNWVIIHR